MVLLKMIALLMILICNYNNTYDNSMTNNDDENNDNTTLWDKQVGFLSVRFDITIMSNHDQSCLLYSDRILHARTRTWVAASSKREAMTKQSFEV